MAKSQRAVVLVSGGLDSCVTAAVAQQDFSLAFFHADYGQRTMRREQRAFQELAAFFQPELTLQVDLSFLGALGGSSLTDGRLPIPRDVDDADRLPSTYVPFRNSIFIAAAVAWAEVIGAVAIFIGANLIDGPGYPDTRPEYFQAYNHLIEMGTAPETHIHLHTPLIHLDKAGIVRLGQQLQAPFHLTWSCYQNEDLACGHCSSCRLRLQGFAQAGLTDPIPYQTGIKEKTP